MSSHSLSVCLSPSSLWVWCWVNPGSPLPGTACSPAWCAHAGPSPALLHTSTPLMRHCCSSCLVLGLAACRRCKYGNFRLPDWKELRGGEESSLVYSLKASSKPALPSSVCPSSPNCGPIRAPPLFVFRPDFPEPGEE